MRPRVYLDEAGISALEPVRVVVAVIVRSQGDMADIEKALTHVKRHVPDRLRDGFVFHAKDLFQRTKGTPSAEIRDEARGAILKELVALPRRLGIPVALAYATRNEPSSEATRRDSARIDHLLAFESCLLSAAKWANKFAPGATMDLIAEDCREMRGMLMKALDDLRSDGAPAFWINGVSLDCLPDPVQFAGKGDALPLQLADACAFAVRRHIEGRKHGATLLSCLTGLAVNPEEWQAPLGHVLYLWRLRSIGAHYGIPSNPYPFGP